MSKDSVHELTQSYLEAVEKELKRAVKRSIDSGDPRLYEMLAYHMGWVGGTSGFAGGKRIRPLLVLLTCEASGGNWKHALPAATAVELVHNFSLIHDDIEDQSPYRRGRPTIWKKWGIPQAINCGDAMFALAHLEAIRLSQTVSPDIAMKAVELLQSTCLHLTQGQFLDLSYETRVDLTIPDYWQMVEGKTAALIAACTELGALASGADDRTSLLYKKFGRFLGLAFQVQDDWLGIWGDSNLTGKSSQSDLITGKITLPILYGLRQAGEFAARWKQGSISPGELPEIIKLLETDGAKEYIESQAHIHIQQALATLDSAEPIGDAAEILKSLAERLINRRA